MIIIYGSCIIFFILLFVLARKEKVPEKWVDSKYKKILYQSSYYLYKKGMGLKKKRNSEKIRKIKEDIRCIEPMGNTEENMLKYNLDKISICLLLLLAGVCILLFVWISQFSDKVLQKGNVIFRNPYGGGSISSTLSARTEDEKETKKVEVLIEERKYTEEELEETYVAFLGRLETAILGQNQNLQKVTSALNLTNHIEGYPFQVSWECSDYTLLDVNGNLAEINRDTTGDMGEIDETGEKIELTAAISYYDWKREHLLDVWVLPQPKNKEEEWKELLLDGIKTKDIETETKNEMILPQQINGKNIIWKEEREDKGKSFVLLILAAILLICYGKDRELHKKVEKRKEEMLRDYPEIVGKMTLLLTAGMTIRSAWKKMVQDYVKKRDKSGEKRYAYEEMLITYYEMESGVSEIKSYDNFAKRCRVANYLKLGVVLGQNLKKGSAGLQQILQREAKEAFEERKSNARKMGEEAGTKLLLPMMLMLAIVIVIIIVPAFLSFSI